MTSRTDTSGRGPRSAAMTLRPVDVVLSCSAGSFSSPVAADFGAGTTLSFPLARAGAGLRTCATFLRAAVACLRTALAALRTVFFTEAIFREAIQGGGFLAARCYASTSSPGSLAPASGWRVTTERRSGAKYFAATAFTCSAVTDA